MKILLTSFLAFILTICCISFASAQTVQTTSSPTITTPVSPVWLEEGPNVGSYSFSAPANTKQHTLAADQMITNFNPALGTHKWGTPFLFSNNAGYFVEPVEWLSVPGSPAQVFLDSITIRFNGLSGDSIFVSLFSDRLVQLQGLDGDFHIADLTSSGKLFDRKAIFIGTTVTQSVDLTIHYPHLAIDPDFHVGILPRIVNNGGNLTPTSTFVLEGDSEATRARTPATSHSNFVYLNLTNGSLGQGLIDSFFSFGGGKPLFSNFNIKAYVSTAATMSGSITVQPSSTINFGSSPVGQTKTAGAELDNNGTTDVTITSISDPAQTIFTVTKPTLPTTIPAGSTLSLSLGFTPKNTGQKSSSFVVTYGDGSTTKIDLQGNATPADQGVTPTAERSFLSFYPNPASSMLNVEGLTGAAQYEVFDAMGRSVQHGSLMPSEHIDISMLIAGQYTIVVNNEVHSFVVAR